MPSAGNSAFTVSTARQIGEMPGNGAQCQINDRPACSRSLNPYSLALYRSFVISMAAGKRIFVVKYRNHFTTSLTTAGIAGRDEPPMSACGPYERSTTGIVGTAILSCSPANVMNRQKRLLYNSTIEESNGKLTDEIDDLRVSLGN